MNLPRLSLAGRSAPVQWLALLLLTVALAGALQAAHFPAAVLLGAMAAGIAGGAADARVRLPSWLFVFSHGLIGCMIARSVRPGFVAELLKDWPLFLGVIVLVILTSGVMGWLLLRRGLLPGTTAIWGMSPGAAAAMTLMSEAHGADMRLVAVMQYLRVVIVVLISSIVARVWVGPVVAPTAADAWFAPIAWTAFAWTMALVVLGSTLGQRLRLPAGALLVPLAVGAVLQASGVLAIELPRWLLALAYAALGWTIGLRFTRPILAHAARVLPVITASIFVLVALCGGLAVLLTYAGIDPLTAYLATSPGGADSVAIIAASSNVDVAFVMGLQTARLIIVILIGPSLARLMSRLATRHAPPP